MNESTACRDRSYWLTENAIGTKVKFTETVVRYGITYRKGRVATVVDVYNAGFNGILATIRLGNGTKAVNISGGSLKAM